MIVCLCHRVSDRDIRQQVQAGVHNFDVLQDETRVASGCGACEDCAREVFDEALAANAVPAAQPIRFLAATRAALQGA